MSKWLTIALVLVAAVIAGALHWQHPREPQRTEYVLINETDRHDFVFDSRFLLGEFEAHPECEVEVVAAGLVDEHVLDALRFACVLPEECTADDHGHRHQRDSEPLCHWVRGPRELASRTFQLHVRVALRILAPG